MKREEIVKIIAYRLWQFDRKKQIEDMIKYFERKNTLNCLLICATAVVMVIYIVVIFLIAEGYIK